MPRWVRLVQKTRAKNSHAWAPLRTQTNIGLREYPSRETIPWQVDRGEGIPSPHVQWLTIYPLLDSLPALLRTDVVAATALPVAYTSKCVRTLQYMYVEAGFITESPRKSPEAEFLDETQIKVLIVSSILFTDLYRFALRFLFLQTYSTSYNF
jgi:hypothetical protein